MRRGAPSSGEQEAVEVVDLAGDSDAEEEQEVPPTQLADAASPARGGGGGGDGGDAAAAACAHGGGGGNAAGAVADTDDDDDEPAANCSICYSLLCESGDHRPATLKCGHIFGESCVRRWLREHARCPQCNAR